ncbi:hypothetical protein MCOR27_002159 [Pyricularia oryzae]|uniref:Uncharacterized protein n=2 Tax=Pyricularia TaxID=48558 RepID=A0ABQ8NK97_PYRGI|nr:hypothetical protein MCOR01_003508 [Pyricularia oryzae]KAI6298395.1 hypothetical protein MCOR33_005468 [Pyricularia grisea]KAH9432185.1 hypothetical protein MCOR02_006890 [Pyricularia oryzae]KAI6256338.1 hypothetical protein MCOR19_007222 [Pyricularia oryzae]KAI6263954.1 hypothetical protein MCOR26_011705 [Pyricularia oryzae]
MQFSMLKVAVATMAVCSDVVLSQGLVATAGQVISNLQTLTTKTQQLQGPAQTLNMLNAPLVVVGQGPMPQIIAGLNDIVSTATTFQAQWNGISPPTTDEISRVATAFRDFSNGQQKFLNILIGKAGVFEQVPFIGQPLTGVLRQLESITETISATLMALPGAPATDLQSQVNNLKSTLDIAVNKFEGLRLTKRSISRRDAFRAALRA